MGYPVVIIDDEPWTREVVRCLGKWEEYGLQVVGEASDGESGLQLIRQIKPDIVITDVHMPHLNGLDLIRTLREEDCTAAVIFISGYDEFEYVKRALVLGAVNYILKPIKEEELNDQLKTCIENIEKQKNRELEKMTFTGDFINAYWAKDFYMLRNDISEALRGREKVILKKKFGEIEQISSNTIAFNQRKEGMEGVSIEREQMVGIYYSLINVLHRYIHSYGYTLSEIFGDKNTSFVFGQQSSINEMLTFIFSLYTVAMDKVEDLQRNKNRLDIEMIKTYIDENYCDGITLEETANRFYISKEYLSKLFKLRTGEGFSEYVTSKRMNKAKELICDLEIPLKDVSDMMGYVDLAHFYKAFKKYFGKTPGVLREELNMYNKTDLK